MHVCSGVCTPHLSNPMFMPVSHGHAGDVLLALLCSYPPNIRYFAVAKAGPEFLRRECCRHRVLFMAWPDGECVAARQDGWAPMFALSETSSVHSRACALTWLVCVRVHILVAEDEDSTFGFDCVTEYKGKLIVHVGELLGDTLSSNPWGQTTSSKSVSCHVHACLNATSASPLRDCHVCFTAGVLTSENGLRVASGCCSYLLHTAPGMCSLRSADVTPCPATRAYITCFLSPLSSRATGASCAWQNRFAGFKPSTCRPGQGTATGLPSGVGSEVLFLATAQATARLSKPVQAKLFADTHVKQRKRTTCTRSGPGGGGRRRRRPIALGTNAVQDPCPHGRQQPSTAMGTLWSRP